MLKKDLMRSYRVLALFLCVCFMLALVGCTGTKSPGAEGNAPETEYPKKPVEFLVPTKPGGGWDITARTVVSVLGQEGLVPVGLPVTNKAGSGGYIGFTHLVEERKGDPYVIMATSLVTLINPKVNDWKYDYKDVTPIARLYSDWEAVYVKADSPLNTVDDIFEALKQDPKSLVIAGATPPDADYLFLSMLADSYGFDLSKANYVGYNGGAEVITSILGGHSDVGVSCIGEAAAQLEAGMIKLVGIATEERMAAPFDYAPTLRELGHDIVFGNWRGFFGPPEMPDYAVAYWRDVLEQMANTEAWKSNCEKFGWMPWFLGDGFDEFLDSEAERIYEELDDIGM